MEVNHFKVPGYERIRSARKTSAKQMRATTRCYNIVAGIARDQPMYNLECQLRQENTALRVENAIVREENVRLREENTRLNKLLTTGEELKSSGPHNYFYKNGQTDGPYCPKCWQKDHRQVLLPPSAKSAAGVGRQCAVCDKLYVEEPASPPAPAIASVDPPPGRSLWARTQGF